MVRDDENQVAIFEPKVALQSTLMPHLATATASKRFLLPLSLFKHYCC